MTLRVDCHVAALRSKLALPLLPLSLAGLAIEEYFARNSRDSAGRSHIAIKQRLHADSSGIPAHEPTDASSLRSALRRIIGKQTATGPTKVGLLFADRYKPRDTVLGYMFDEGAFPDDPAREGCVVFLDRIRDFRKAEGAAAVSTEIGFTSVHELGHLFNLWHMHSPPNVPNFMSRSGDVVYDEGAFEFDPYQCDFLRLADVEPFVWPGGGAYGERPGWPPGDDPFDAVSKYRPARNLELKIDVDQREFWPFEPIELEVALKLRPDGPDSLSVPDEIDPGYDRFQIWIEEPTGGRRRYRSPRRYCGNAATIRIERNRAFKRDISIFLGGGGYTFRVPGLNRISARLTLPDGTIVESNDVPVEVRPARPDLRDYRTLHDVCTHRPVARLLYYRTARLSPRDVERLETFIRGRRRTSAAAAGTLYALGRHFERGAWRRTGTSARRARKMAIARLERAADHPELSSHRRRLSARLAEDLRAGG